MAKSKSDRIVERLEQIKDRAAEMTMQDTESTGITGAGLAEEAAGLGIELAALAKEKK